PVDRDGRLAEEAVEHVLDGPRSARRAEVPRPGLLVALHEHAQERDPPRHGAEVGSAAEACDPWHTVRRKGLTHLSHFPWHPPALSSSSGKTPMSTARDRFLSRSLRLAPTLAGTVAVLLPPTAPAQTQRPSPAGAPPLAATPAPAALAKGGASIRPFQF